MTMLIAALCGLYLAGAALIRLPKLLRDALAWVIAAVLFWRDRRRAVILCAFTKSQSSWCQDRSAQRALDRASRSALILTTFVTSNPTQSDRAIRFLRDMSGPSAKGR